MSKEKIKFNDSQDALDFAEAITNTVREPLVILDGDFKVVSISGSFCRTFKVKSEETEGQFIYDLGNRQWDIPKLRTLLEEIIPNNASFDDFEVEHDFPSIGHKLMLLNARRIPHPPAKPRFILLAIEDITARRYEEQRERYRERLVSLIKECTAELVQALSDRKNVEAGLTNKVHSSEIEKLGAEISKLRAELKEIP